MKVNFLPIIPVRKLACCLISMLVISSLAGCANWSEESGVENHWRSASTPVWTPGKTISDDIMKHLGPPSQIVDLHDQVVFYYMKETASGKGYYFLVYNTSQSQTRYDRAIFFFDAEGVLLRYSYSNESIDPQE